jgi:serine/threonine-protein kinase
MRSSGPSGGDLLARRYRLIDRVGAGGMSVVWRARDELLDRLVAVKWLGAELGGDEIYRDLVRREAWATARIKHPAVAAVYDYGEVPGPDGHVTAYVVMEMLDGEPLAARMRLGPLAWAEAVSICADIAEALATAHEHGVVHRDITPDNVMLTSSGVKVFDFGIAVQVGEPDDDANGSTFGTPTYVAPERLDGLPAQTATDVYALGVLLFETLTGEPPFPEDAWDDVAAREPRDIPRLAVPGLPGPVARICRRCLEHEPIDRPTAREVALLLRAYASPRSRRRALAAAVTTVAVLGAVATGVSVWWPDEDNPTGSLGNLVVSTTTAGTPAATGGVVEAPTTPPEPPPTSAAPTSQPPVVTTPPTSPAVTISPTPPRQSVNTAIANLTTVINQNRTSGGLREDVALDFSNEVNNINVALTNSPPQEVQNAVARLQGKVDQRFGEGSMSQGAYDQLRTAVAAVQNALT